MLHKRIVRQMNDSPFKKIKATPPKGIRLSNKYNGPSYSCQRLLHCVISKREYISHNKRALLAYPTFTSRPSPLSKRKERDTASNNEVTAIANLQHFPHTARVLSLRHFNSLSVTPRNWRTSFSACDFATFHTVRLSFIFYFILFGI